MPYEATPVGVVKTKEQIERLLRGQQVVAIRFTSFPAYALLEFTRKVESGGLIPYRVQLVPRSSSGNSAAGVDRAERQVWRVCYWWLKAKFEAIDFGLVEFEQVMLPYMLVQGAEGKAEPMAKVFFAHLAGKLAPPDDPFGGMMPRLTSPGDKEPTGA